MRSQEGVEVPSLEAGHHLLSRLEERGGEVDRFEGLAGARFFALVRGQTAPKHTAPLEVIAKLAHVAGPAGALHGCKELWSAQPFGRLGGDPQRWYELLDDGGNVLGSLAKRRENDLHHGQAVVQVRPEATCVH